MSKNKSERFDIVSMKRSEIAEHPQNPRHIDDESRKRLRRIIKEHGLVEPLVVNKRTGRLVSGHQRLSIMDGIERGSDYDLTVSLIDVDEKAEKALLIALNNTSAQGGWDTDMLEVLLKEIDWQDVGFTPEDLQMMDLDTSILENTLAEPQAVKDSVAELKSMDEKAKLVAKAQRQAKEGEDEDENEEGSEPIDYRALRNEQQAKAREDASTANYLTIYFTDLDQALTLREAMGLDGATQTISAQFFMSWLADIGVELDMQDEE